MNANEIKLQTTHREEGAESAPRYMRNTTDAGVSSVSTWFQKSAAFLAAVMRKFANPQKDSRGDAQSPYVKIDHIAVAVHDLEEAISFHEDVLGLKLKERRAVTGEFTGMTSAVMDAGPFTVVLIQGSQPTSQVSQYVAQYGAGVQHVALATDDVKAVRKSLKDKGLPFATGLINGQNLRQTFSARDENSGMMYEFIQRIEGQEFEDQNVETLFRDMEKGGHV